MNTKRTLLHKIGKEDIMKASMTLREYKNGKTSLEARIVEDEQWWKLRHNSIYNNNANANTPVSAWLFNSLISKHADVMDGYPEASILPRDKDDTQEAKYLSGVLPSILENNDFEKIYSDNWWYKLKHGCSAYGVFWNSEAENGLGDIQIKKIDLLNVFWEPGITDIQKSRNLFIVDLRDTDILQSEYSALGKNEEGSIIDIKQYIYDDTVDTSGKTLVVDWYYKSRNKDGKTVLHYCKFAGNTLLFASENEEEFRECGWYDHGEYPIVFDTLYPEEGTPTGFGYIAVTKSPQMYIDKLNQALLDNAMIASKPRYFAKMNAGINESEFLDWSKPIVHVEGDLNEERLRQITVSSMPGSVMNILRMKIDELKETSSNSDFTRGGIANGVTAASAIVALQEAGGKSSRDMMLGTYRCFVKINYLCIELIRQFYGELRSFRIREPDGTFSFMDYSNKNIKKAERKPVFDIKVKAQKKNPYSKAVQNETAKELFKLGFFNPEYAGQALGALEIMEFEGKFAVEEKIRESAKILNQNKVNERGKLI